MEIRWAHMNKLSSAHSPKSKGKERDEDRTKRNAHTNSRVHIVLRLKAMNKRASVHHTSAIHKNLFVSSIFVPFCTIAFSFIYISQIYYIILVLCFSPFETGVSLSGRAEKNTKCALSPSLSILPSIAMLFLFSFHFNSFHFLCYSHFYH